MPRRRLLHSVAVCFKLVCMKNTFHIQCFSCLMLCVLMLPAGCIKAPLRMDLDTCLQKQADCAGQDIIITASLDDVLARYGLYENKKIEVAAPVIHYRSFGFWTWYLMLEENGKTLRCYTHYYRIEPGWDAINLLDRAIRGKRPVTVLGTLRKDGIDILQLTCDNETAKPNFKPPRPTNGWWMQY
jgi:hypothetical protein